jgi:hypothetical protein
LRGKYEVLPPQDEILPVVRRLSRKNPNKIFGSVGNYSSNEFTESGLN